MNGQMMIDDFELDDFDRLLDSVGRSIEVYEEGIIELSKAAPGTEKRFLMVANRALRETILKTFDDLLDMVADRDKAFADISEAMKATARNSGEAGISGIKAFYLAFRSYSETTEEDGSEVLIAGLPEDIKTEIEDRLKNASDSGQAFINDSPVIKKLMRPAEDGKEKLEISLSKRAEAVFTVLDGWVDPYEIAILEEIGKFKFLENQVTANGKTYCTLGQLYRALRGGGGQSPTAAQRETMLKELQKLSENDRKITFKLNDYAKIWGGFETNGGRVRIVSYDEYFGKIRGQEDTLIVFDETLILHAIAENLKMYEIIPQEIKAIQERVYTVTTATGETLKGNARKIRSLKAKHGITDEDVIAEEFEYKKMSLSRARIALRTQLLKFVFSYLRARTKNVPHSNQLNYTTIFQNCNINEKSRETVRRSKEDIAAMLEHFQNQNVISGWQEYTNRGSKKPDGIEIFIERPECAIEQG